MKPELLAVLRKATALSLVALVVVTGSVLWHAFPSSEAVRLRNSLLIENAPVASLDWTPQNVPSDFKMETLPVPESMRSAARMVAAQTNGTDLDVARALTAHLMVYAINGGRINSFDVSETYKTIVTSGAGYCSDIIDSFIALAQADGIFVRPWAFSFDGFGGLGHIVVEIYDRQRGKWIMLDVFNDVLPLDRQSGQPLSVSEFRSAFMKNSENIVFSPIGPGRQEFPIYKKLIEYYSAGIDQWYFWNGNNVFGRADNWIVKSAEVVGEEAAELASIAVQRFPGIVPIRSASNRNALQAMEYTRRFLMVAAIMDAVFMVGIVVGTLSITAVSVRRVK